MGRLVDHQVLDQPSILRFIEDNWQLGRIGDQSFDAKASSMASMFDFRRSRRAENYFLLAGGGSLGATTAPIARQSRSAALGPVASV